MKKHRGRHLLSLLASAALLASLLPAAFAAEAEGEKHITILGTSDMHGNIWAIPTKTTRRPTTTAWPGSTPTSSKCGPRTPTPSSSTPATTIQGTIMTDDLYNKTPEEPHPVVTAMNYMAMTP